MRFSLKRPLWRGPAVLIPQGRRGPRRKSVVDFFLSCFCSGGAGHKGLFLGNPRVKRGGSFILSLKPVGKIDRGEGRLSLGRGRTLHFYWGKECGHLRNL